MSLMCFFQLLQHFIHYLEGGKILSNGEISSLVQTYDIESDAWSELPSLPNSVYGHQCASVNKRIYVIGGKTNEQVC